MYKQPLMTEPEIRRKFQEFNTRFDARMREFCTMQITPWNAAAAGCIRADADYCQAQMKDLDRQAEIVFLEAQRLRQAASKGDIEALREAIAQSHHINARDENGNTALILAAKNGHLECVKLLAKYKIDLTLKCYPEECDAITMASNAGHVDVVKFLLKHKGVAETSKEYKNLLATAESNAPVNSLEFSRAAFDSWWKQVAKPPELLWATTITSLPTPSTKATITATSSTTTSTASTVNSVKSSSSLVFNSATGKFENGLLSEEERAAIPIVGMACGVPFTGYRTSPSTDATSTTTASTTSSSSSTDNDYSKLVDKYFLFSRLKSTTGKPTAIPKTTTATTVASGTAPTTSAEAKSSTHERLSVRSLNLDNSKDWRLIFKPAIDKADKDNSPPPDDISKLFKRAGKR